MGDEVRRGVLGPDPPAGSCARRQMASRRSRHFDRRRALLAVACGRSKRLRARRSGSASKRQRRGAPAHDEAPQGRPHAAARHDHRQAPILRRGAGKDGPSRRASPAQRTHMGRFRVKGVQFNCVWAISFSVVFGIQGLSLIPRSDRFHTRSNSHSVAVRGGCTNIPLAAVAAQEGETILNSGFSDHSLVRFVHPDPPGLIRSWKISGTRCALVVRRTPLSLPQ